MRYEINGVSNDELITRYFEREDNILVRYYNGKSDIVNKDRRDYLDDVMREQAHYFVKQKGGVIRAVLEEEFLKIFGIAYIITVVELILRGTFDNQNPLTMGVGFAMWLVGENLGSYLIYEKDFVFGESKIELQMIKKYKLFLKNEKRILEYLKDNPREFSGKINDLDFLKYKELKEIVRLSKRKRKTNECKYDV